VVIAKPERRCHMKKLVVRPVESVKTSATASCAAA